jgi:hypothetical protein
VQVAAADQVKDALGSTSLLLVFVTVLFNAKYADIRAALASSMPTTGPADVKTWREDIWDCLRFHLGPVLVVSTGAAIIFLPVVKTIVTQRPLAYWDNLDFAVTTFLFVFVVVMGMAAWAIYRAVALFGRVREADAYLKLHP